jgi:hypothetical protein
LTARRSISGSSRQSLHRTLWLFAGAFAAALTVLALII